MPDSLVLIDKEQGWTSHDVVAKLRGILGTRKIGHAGTLDPMATGLLVLGVDAGTKLLQFISGSPKQYLATVRLGAATHTDDAEGHVVFEAPANLVTESQIDIEISRLLGTITQVPSSVSAIKIDGKRAYDLVREGKDVELKGREVEVKKFERTSQLRVHGNYLDFDVLVDCSSGTYIRALARDIGTALGVGGHLTALRRTTIGNFDVKGASLLSDGVDPISLELAVKKLFPVIEISATQAQDLVYGKRLQMVQTEVTAALWQGKLLAVVEPIGNELRSVVVFPGAFSA
ncbi:MAG: tRNA pseudouridine(55) synthase TruB [Actinomycetota bacterium]